MSIVCYKCIIHREYGLDMKTSFLRNFSIGWGWEGGRMGMGSGRWGGI